MDRLTPRPIVDATVDLLERFCAVSSPTGDRDGLARATALYGEALAARGLRVEPAEEPGDDGRLLPVLFASTDAQPSVDGDLLVIGHVDTVLPASTPWRDGERLWATGAVDMKGGLAALVGALDLLAETGRRPPPGLRVAVVPDEEVVGAVSKAVVRRLAPTARAFWVLEPGQPRPADGRASETLVRETLVIGRRGLLTWSLDVEGRAAHAGNGFWDGRSALEAAADWTMRARALTEPGPGPTVNPGRLVAGDRAFVEDLAEHADLLFSPRQTNVVPDRARVEGEARSLRPADGERLERALPALADAVAAEHDVTTTFTFHERVPPLAPADGARALAARAEALAAERGWRLLAEEDRRGISFPNFMLDPSVVPILDGLGPVGGGMHTRDEYVDLASLDRRITLLADLLAES